MLIVGVDASTTAVKAIAWDGSGTAIAEARTSLSLENPGTDAWEQDAESWWTALRSSLASLTESLGPRSAEIRALAIAHQRETFVLGDDNGDPLGPAIVWMDARGREQVARATRALGADKLHQTSGKPACITPSFYKLLALFEREPETKRRSPRLLDVHAFLARRLTGEFKTSLAAADPLGLVDMKQRAWAADLVGFAGLDLARLPALVEPGALLGRLTATKTGLPADLPIIAGAGDGQAAGLGAGIVAPGRAYLNLGTAVVSGVLSDSFVTDVAFRTLYAATVDAFFLESDLKGGTFTLTWLAEKWCNAAPDEVGTVLGDLERRAHALPPGANGLALVPYWNGVMNPYWDDDATGVVMGLTGSHGPSHLYRAILEGIAFEERLHADGIESATNQPIEEMVVMGGGSESDLFCQILADVLARPIVRARSKEATALGAGVLAAVAAGVHPDIPTAVAHMTATGKRFVPGKDQPLYDSLYREVYQPIFPALRGPMKHLARLTRS